MNLYVVEDSQAQDNFGYRKIQQYQIFVKKTVYHQMLKTELKKPLNWLMWGWQVLRLFASVIGQALIGSTIVAWLHSLFLLTSAHTSYEVVTVQDIQEMVLQYFELFKIYVVLFVICNFTLRFSMPSKRNQFYALAPHNAFTQRIFQTLHQQVVQLDEAKNEKNMA